MAKVSNKVKLDAVKEWLTSNNIEYAESYVTRTTKLAIDLWIPSLFIAIHVGDDDGTFYKKTYKWCKPFFIRDNETKKFVLEKIRNCCFDQMVFMQRKFEKKSGK